MSQTRNPEQRNLIIAVVLSLLIFGAFQIFFEGPRQQRLREQQQQQQQATEQAAGQPQVTGAQVTDVRPAPTTTKSRNEALATAQRVRIQTPSLHGTLPLTGNRIDDLRLAKYREQTDPNSPEVTLLSPGGTEHPYYAEFGWISDDPTVKLPDASTVWQGADANATLAPGKPLTLTWDNGAGLVFERKIDVDQDYLFTVTQRVINKTDKPVALTPFSLVSRQNPAATQAYVVLHEGPLGIFDSKLDEKSYDDLKKKPVEHTTLGGWLGFTDKYWLVAAVPPSDAKVAARFTHANENGRDLYQADYAGPKVTVAPGESTASTERLFAGAKEMSVLTRYEREQKIDRLDDAVDWGWFFFLTKPFFYGLDAVGKLVGNFGIAILVFTVIVRLVVFPIANAGFRSANRMKDLQPKMQALKERYKDDPTKFQQEMMALYKREKINPASGCLPILIQIPIFFALYKVLLVTIEMRHAPFFGWIHDLSSPDPTTIFNLFGLIPWTPPHILMLGAWPILMGITQFFQMRMTPMPDPAQQRIMQFLPLIFMYMMKDFPAGLVIYWTWTNLLSIAQQKYLRRTTVPKKLPA
jgi:YidC/Oxa1 family membrane protein insertase